MSKKPKDWRIDNRIRITDLAKKARVSIGTLSKVENELIAPGGRTLFAYWTLSNGEVTPDDFAWPKRRRV